MIGSSAHRSQPGRAVNWKVYVTRDSPGDRSVCRMDAAHSPKKGGESISFTAATLGGSNET